MTVLLALLLLGCPGPKDPKDPCLPGGEPTLELGTGYTAFEPLGDGDEVSLDHGVQGGYHVAIALRATNLSDRGDGVLVMEGTIDGEVVGEADTWVQLECTDEALEAWGTLLIYDDVPENLHEQDTTITAELRDIDGTIVEASVEARIIDSNL